MVLHSCHEWRFAAYMSLGWNPTFYQNIFHPFFLVVFFLFLFQFIYIWCFRPEKINMVEMNQVVLPSSTKSVVFLPFWYVLCFLRAWILLNELRYNNVEFSFFSYEVGDKSCLSFSLSYVVFVEKSLGILYHILKRCTIYLTYLII